MRRRCSADWASAAVRSAVRNFLSDFQPVSIKMAKEQGLSLNPDQNIRQLRAADVLPEIRAEHL